MAFSKQNFDILNKRIDVLIKDKTIDKRSLSLIHLLLSQRFLKSSDEIKESIVDGGNECGVDSIFIDRSSQQPLINIIQSKCHTSEKKAKNAFQSTAIDKILRFFEILKDNEIDLKKVTNPALEQKILEIRDIQKNDFPIFKVWLISNGQPCVPHEIETTVKQLKTKEVELKEFHLDDFIEFCINKHSARSQHVFNVKDAGVLEAGDTELYSIVGYISASELYSILKDLRDERKLDYALFDLNVRSFLGLESPINKDIAKSALSKDNHRFSSLNNGITLVGTDVKVMKTGYPLKIGVKKMSIVNGAQTCSAIFDCMKDDYPNFEKFDKLSVLFRLFKTDDIKTIEQISVSTNSQNRIQPRDLRANDEYQINLEKKLRDRGIHYLRKRGGFEQDDSDLPKLDALKAGQLIQSYMRKDPTGAKKYSDHIFSDWYVDIFSSVDIDQLLRAHELYSKIEDKQKYVDDEVRIRGAYRTENTFITYGGFHVLTLCSLLEDINPKKSDDEIINEAIKIVTEVMREAGEPAYYNFFRNSKMTDKMIEKCSQLNLFEEKAA